MTTRITRTAATLALAVIMLTVPPYESAQLVRALKKEGKIFFYYTYAHGGHGFTDREHWLDALQKQQIFLRKYLQPSYGNSSTSADDLLFSQK